LLAEGLKAHPDRLRLAMALARLQLERQAMPDALRTMEAGLPYAQESGEYLAMTAELKARAGQFGPAADLYQSALRTAPGNGTWLIGQGLALRAGGRTDEAFDVFQHARDLKFIDPQQRALVERQLRELGG
jgi:Flp pilus assembly protein TadD